MALFLAMVLVAVGLFLSALFSGSETGFYRATRVRLVLDALGGDRVSRGLVWLTNHPLLLVATVLVGNNVANYLTAMAIVMGTRELLPFPETGGGAGGEYAAEIVAPMLLTPLLFVYGELLPKSLFLQAPNRLLRRVGPLLLGFVGLFLPVSTLLWALNGLLARFLGESPEIIRLTLARRELRRVLEEGHEAGILHPAQRRLAQGIFNVARHSVAQFLAPLDEWPRGREPLDKEQLLGLARRHRGAIVLIESDASAPRLVGYYRVLDLALSPAEEIGPPRPFLDVAADTSQLAALTQMQNAGEELARVVDPAGEPLGIVTAERLREPLFSHGG